MCSGSFMISAGSITSLMWSWWTTCCLLVLQYQLLFCKITIERSSQSYSFCNKRKFTPCTTSRGTLWKTYLMGQWSIKSRILRRKTRKMGKKLLYSTLRLILLKFKWSWWRSATWTRRSKKCSILSAFQDSSFRPKMASINFVICSLWPKLAKS